MLKPYTIMYRKGILGSGGHWQPVAGSDGEPLVASSARVAVAICHERANRPYELSQGEYASPEYGYTQPSGKIARVA